jgi:hypothetical protein
MGGTRPAMTMENELRDKNRPAAALGYGADHVLFLTNPDRIYPFTASREDGIP